MELLADYYLAHPTSSRKEVREWELGFEKRTGISLLNPFYDTDRPDIRDMDAGKKTIREIDHNILVEKEIALIKNSNKGVIPIINGASSYGTIQEMVYGHIFGKEVYSIISNGKENHPWLKKHSTKIFTDLFEFEKWIKH